MSVSTMLLHKHKITARTLKDLSLKQFFVFDMDETLTPEGRVIPAKMARVLAEIAKHKDIAIISGKDIEQILQNVLYSIKKHNTQFRKIYIASAGGGAIWQIKQDKTILLKEHRLSQQKINEVVSEFVQVLRELNMYPKKIYGDLALVKKGAVSLTLLGYKAPMQEKDKADPDFAKRKAIIKLLQKRFKDVDFNISGKTTIELTQKGVNKAKALGYIVSVSGLQKSDVVYFGDSFSPEGNDFSVLKAGYTCIKVNNWQETFEILQQLLGYLTP